MGRVTDKSIITFFNSGCNICTLKPSGGKKKSNSENIKTFFWQAQKIWELRNSFIFNISFDFDILENGTKQTQRNRLHIKNILPDHISILDIETKILHLNTNPKQALSLQA